MTDWPLHVTLADVFAIDRDKTNIEAKLAELLAGQPHVITHVTKAATLGITPVVLLERSKDLIALHIRIADLLEMNGAKFNSPEFARKGFLSHSTVQARGQLDVGDKVSIYSLTLIDMFPDGDWQRRKILSTFGLQGKPF